MENKDIYVYHELSYNKGYNLTKESLISLIEDDKRPSLESGKSTLETFFKLVDAYNKENNIEINPEKFIGMLERSNLSEAPVFGIQIDYEALFERYKNSKIDDFYLHIINLKEAISICIMNELIKKRIDLEFGLYRSEETIAHISDIESKFDYLFEFKSNDNNDYTAIDSLVDEYMSENVNSMSKTFVGGNPYEVLNKMVECAKKNKILN